MRKELVVTALKCHIGAMNFDPDAPAQPGAGIFGLHTTPAQSQIMLVPVPFDATASYGQGASLGPAAILEASHQVDLFDLDTGRPYEAGIYMLPFPDDIVALNAEARALVHGRRQGDLRAAAQARVDHIGAEINAKVYAKSQQLMQQGHIVGVVGGDHATPFGNIRAYAEAYPGLGVLQIDAHADLRHAYEGLMWSHASIMHNVLHHTRLRKLVQVGVRDLAEREYAAILRSRGRIVTFFDRDIRARQYRGISLATIWADVVAQLPQAVYVSFDIDGLDPTLCPHTGTPVPGGLQFAEACALLAAITQSGRRIVGFDLNEVAPGPGGGQWDGNVGARVLYKLCGHALWGHRPPPDAPAKAARSAA